MPAMRWVAIVQGVYFFLTGIWPIVHIRSFMWVTGPKHDLWLVRTVGVLVLVIGGVLALAGIRNTLAAELITLAIGSAVALTAIDTIYSLRGTISKIYLADAVAEIALVIVWSVLLLSR
jgi:hypothetical protein